MEPLHQDRDRGVDCSGVDHHCPGLHHLHFDPRTGPVPSDRIRREAGDHRSGRAGLEVAVHLPGTRHRHGQQDRVPGAHANQLQDHLRRRDELVLHPGPGRPDLRDGGHADQAAFDRRPQR
ncbi:hypothetical protein D3C87_1604500 [compost metagenome]